MTNFEKYYIDLVSVGFALVKGKPANCRAISCSECDFGEGDNPTYFSAYCNNKRMEWLKAEYEEPKITIPEGTPVDTKVLVSMDGIKWIKKYYAGKRNGKHVVWQHGATSWTCEPDEISQWGYMKLAKEEE